MRSIAAAALAAALGLAGCGGGSPNGDITKSVRGWTAALADRDGKRACGHMTDAARDELAAFAKTYTDVAPTGECATNATRFARKLSAIALRQMRDADVAKIRVDGDRASVQMEDGGPNELILRRAGGEWRVEHAFRRGWRLLGAPRFGMTPG